MEHMYGKLCYTVWQNPVFMLQPGLHFSTRINFGLAGFGADLTYFSMRQSAMT